MATKGVVFYTDNRIDPAIGDAVQKQLLRSVNGHYLVSVSLQPLDFGDNITLGLTRGWLTLFQQILTGVSHAEDDVIFLCEHDVLYNKSHFDFCPDKNDVVFYNENVWRVSAQTGHALYHKHKSLSQLCASRRLLIDHLRERIARIERDGFTFKMGFEPGTKSLRHGGVDDLQSEAWFSETPNIDIRDTGSNATRTLWHREDFRNQRFTTGWTESSEVPSWGITEGRFPDFLEDVAAGRIPV